MTKPFIIGETDEELFNKSIEYNVKRGISVQCHISDIHFGVIDPKVQFDILQEQFLDSIDSIIFDCISVDGDLFKKLNMSNTDSVLYASLFVNKLVAKCRKDRTTLVLLAGTKEHDAGQLKLFYHYLADPTVDIRIVEDIRFEYIHGCKVLCIPELYGLDENIYRKFLFESGLYDMVFMHGTIKGAVYGDNAGRGRVFSLEDFAYCGGPIIAGHVHTGGCFDKYMYYNGSPIRWCFGEENEKGFQIVLYDMDTRWHLVHLVPIKSFRYDTISIDDLLLNRPEEVIEYIDTLKEKEGIDYLRLRCIPTAEMQNTLKIIQEYYKNNDTIKFKTEKLKSDAKLKASQEQKELYDQYSYLFDKSMSAFDKLAQFIMDSASDVYIKGDDIKKLLEEDIA